MRPRVIGCAASVVCFGAVPMHARGQGCLEHGWCVHSDVIACARPGDEGEPVGETEASAGPRYNPQWTWQETATDGAVPMGGPITLTYSFCVDGTDTGHRANDESSVLYSFMDATFESRAQWEALLHSSFARWGELTGVTFVYEPNDDGAPLFDSPGVLGVRGDIRVAAAPLTTYSPSTLAFATFYPSGGDIVLDSLEGDYFGFELDNYVLLRNTVTHEIGHTLGLGHFFPSGSSVLMRPTITAGFDGPQHDDVRGIQKHYGDPHEQNDSPASATDLGVLSCNATAMLPGLPGLPIAQTSSLSLNEFRDSDYFVFSVDGPTTVEVAVEHVGMVYDDDNYSCSGSTPACCEDGVIDSQRIFDTAFQVIDASTMAVLTDVDDNEVCAADPSEGRAIELGSAGAYYVRVYTNDIGRDQQFYELRVMARTPVEPCDTDGSCAVDFFDLLAFLDVWFSGDPGANYNGDGRVDFFDLLDYLDCWFAA